MKINIKTCKTHDILSISAGYTARKSISSPVFYALRNSLKSSNRNKFKKITFFGFEAVQRFIKHCLAILNYYYKIITVHPQGGDELISTLYKKHRNRECPHLKGCEVFVVSDVPILDTL